MDREAALSAIGLARVVAILRGDFRETAGEVAGVLVEAGLRAIEVSLTSPGAIEVIATLAAAVPPGVAIGAGTVRTSDECHRVAAVGARFVISPHTRSALIVQARGLNLAVIPGALSPTEIVTALDAGADAVKVFPAEWIGPAGFSALLAPFPGVRFVPTGGVDVERAAEYLARGAWAVGVGSPLAGADVRAPGGLQRLATRARDFARVAAEAQPFARAAI